MEWNGWEGVDPAGVSWGLASCRALACNQPAPHCEHCEKDVAVVTKKPSIVCGTEQAGQLSSWPHCHGHQTACLALQALAGRGAFSKDVRSQSPPSMLCKCSANRSFGQWFLPPQVVTERGLFSKHNRQSASIHAPQTDPLFTGGDGARGAQQNVQAKDPQAADRGGPGAQRKTKSLALLANYLLQTSGPCTCLPAAPLCARRVSPRPATTCPLHALAACQTRCAQCHPPRPVSSAPAMQVAIANQAATLAAYEAPDSFVRPGYQAADQVTGWRSAVQVALACQLQPLPHAT